MKKKNKNSQPQAKFTSSYKKKKDGQKMLKNGQTYFKYFAVATPQDF